ncbi:FAD-binding oxidoreductase [Caballeronia sp. Lep1P3]|uniref:NAD(P)/FAD-dependent oxidoreductase n=1 Tax=Caballeronia sp. Lep1P3 TaxID=2878150 RepID=UPI001FD0EF95|nr:FAD-binding oxidoreductase [Caballeronia sp. Lep1P3]
MEQKFDAMVLGGGIVGVCVALHLQKRGLAVALVDNKAPGNETSFGNAGLIQREGVYPYAFPRDFGTLARYATNRALDVRYHARALAGFLPFLYRYWHHSRPDRHAAIARSYATLIEHCVTEHRALIDESGANGLLRPGGWTKVFRTHAAMDAAVKEARLWQTEYDVGFDALDAAALHAYEPALSSRLVGAVRHTSAESVSDPNALVAAYARRFEALGGRVVMGDARTLENGWRLRTEAGVIEAKAAVIALGPWSAELARKFGYSLPLQVKRGYHMHYAARDGARLNVPVLDAEAGYVIAPMTRGIRLTTGVELGQRDAPPTPVQLDAVEPLAREIFPLGERIDEKPWLGRRPCTPDMMPVIGRAPRHENLWFAFGHAHHGLTLGPVTGRLIADLMTGAKPFVDARPFSADRFV